MTDQPQHEPAVLSGVASTPAQQMTKLLNFVSREKASDLHLKTGYPPYVRLGGHLRRVQLPVLPDSSYINKMVLPLVPEGRLNEFDQTGSLDFSTQIESGDRFRINLFKAGGDTHVAMRRVQADISDFNDLNLPDIYRRMVTDVGDGLVLVCGVTGSGKSSTLAAMLDHINHTRSLHVITIEDPVEFHFVGDRSIISQREIGIDARNFPEALRVVVRQDPDVILIGEMRDLETIGAALTIAETGHLVLATLHTNSAAESVNRIIDAFPSHQQAQVRAQLAFVLEGVVTQTLLPKSKGKGRVVAAEVMICTPAIRAVIRDEKIHQIYSLMQAGKKHGMQTLNDSLQSLYLKGDVTLEEALKRSPDPQELLRAVGEPVPAN